MHYLPKLRTTLLSLTCGAALFTGACSEDMVALGEDSELTAASCSDGLDNDGDGLEDCDDPDCAGSGEEGVQPVCPDVIGSEDAGPGPTPDAQPQQEDNVYTCDDGIDNDLNGLIDCDDPGCVDLSVCGLDPTVPYEDTPENCDDGIDNDSDGTIDCQDSSCETFCPAP